MRQLSKYLVGIRIACSMQIWVMEFISLFYWFAVGFWDGAGESGLTGSCNVDPTVLGGGEEQGPTVVVLVLERDVGVVLAAAPIPSGFWWEGSGKVVDVHECLYGEG